MAKDDILKKIKDLVMLVPYFEERDVVYVLVEIYKIKERELGGRAEVATNFPRIYFFRNWVAHTNLTSRNLVEGQESFNNTEELLNEFISIIEEREVKNKIIDMWPSFIESLNLITQDQDIFIRNN